MTAAPGGPGLPPRWTDARKSGVGTSLGRSTVWFTVGQGIVNEVYYPRVDQPSIRDLGIVVTAAGGYFSEEKRDTDHAQSQRAPGVPAYRLTNTCKLGRYRLDKDLITDPVRDVLLQRTHFAPLQGDLGEYRVVMLVAPRLGNRGYENTGWVGEYKGMPMVFAEGAGRYLALGVDAPLLQRSVGFVGVSDAWQELIAHGEISHPYDRAEGGNLGLAVDVDVAACGGSFVVALGFGHSPEEAGNRVTASLHEGFSPIESSYVEEWEDWHQRYAAPPEAADPDLYRNSLMVLKAHEGKDFPGGLVASLSIPWGSVRGDDEQGGYHLVWPRDLVLSAGAHLAAGAKNGVKPVLGYLKATQEADGSWPQNMWVDGTPHWGGVQLDETALPILLVDLAARHGALSPDERSGYWSMVRKAAGFLVRQGPLTPQDRWEENAGYSPFTLATLVAALLAAADLADAYQPELAGYLRDTADFWNASVEDWTFATDTPLARRIGVEGYYVRIAPTLLSSDPEATIPIANRPQGADPEPAWSVVSPDALALVRFGLRAPDDPRVVATVKVIDALLMQETPAGPGWYRYNGDGYGEHPDGSPYDGTGAGRLWPLLTAERAHYELAARRQDRAEALARAVAATANEGGMLPEQVWDDAPIPERRLSPGRPTGAATPLVWAHGEYLKLVRSLADGSVFDVPPQPVRRYQKDQVTPRISIWRPDAPVAAIPRDRILRIELPQEAVVDWRVAGESRHQVSTQESGFGHHLADIPTKGLEPGAMVAFNAGTDTREETMVVVT